MYVCLWGECVYVHAHRHALVSVPLCVCATHALRYVYITRVHECVCVCAGSCMMLVAPHPLGCMVSFPLISPGCSDSLLPILPPDLIIGVGWEGCGVTS